MASRVVTRLRTSCRRIKNSAFCSTYRHTVPIRALPWHSSTICRTATSCYKYPGRVQSRPCSSMMEKSALEKVNQEMVSQPQSKLFAVVHICGRQFKVTPNDLVVVNKLHADIGESIFLEKVLLAGSENFTLLGTPILNPDLVRVTATVVEHGRAAKIVIFKKKRRKNYKRKKGYRQDNTTLRINSIELKPTLS